MSRMVPLILSNFTDDPCLINLSNFYIWQIQQTFVTTDILMPYAAKKNVITLMVSRLHPGVPACALALKPLNGTQPL